MRPSGRAGVLLWVAFALLWSTLAACGQAPPAPSPPPDLSSGLREAVTVEGIMEHERAFARIAEENGGNRAAGTPGYDASVDYVAGELREAGYQVDVQRFEIPASARPRIAALESVRPAQEYAPNTDFAPMEYSASGKVQARVRPVDAALPAGAEPNSSTSGCEPEDFAGFPEGDVALLRRGTCTFGEKAGNAEAAGAAAVLISNEGQAGRREVLRGTLGGPGVGVPVLGTSAGAGEELAAAARDGAMVRLSVESASETATTGNVVAETPGGDADHTVMVGAHLDSVPESPGINDNGSGSATVLEIALRMAEVNTEPRNKVRFAFWGAEELGLLGSTHYVESLEGGEIDDVAVYLNFDMVGSPNFIREVYDARGEPESVFTDYFAKKGIEVDVSSGLEGRSDHGPFADEGIPTGGLFTGAEGIKSEAEAAAFGGEAGAPHDPCYHQACDDIDNLDKEALGQFSDAAAHATAAFASKKY